MDSKVTEAARRRYNRIAPVYDFMEGLVERSRYSQWRKLLWSKVEGNRILEVGVRTGKNLPYYPDSMNLSQGVSSSSSLSEGRSFESNPCATTF